MIASFIGVAFALLQAKSPDPGGHNILHPVAPQASQIEWLYWTIFWILLVVYVLMIVGFTKTAVANRTAATSPLPVTTDEEGDRRAKWAA